MKNLLFKCHLLLFLLFLLPGTPVNGQGISESPWYRFSADNKECIVTNSNLPTPWLNRLGNDVFFTWITQNGYIESFLLDPVLNGLTNPQNTSGRFYIRDRSDGKSFQINKPSDGKGKWESHIGLGYNSITNDVSGIRSEATYFIPRNENALVMIVTVGNHSGESKTLDLFGQVEWNLGDPVKSIIYKGDGRGGSQFNLYKKARFQDNAIIATQANWKSTADCKAWPYTGFFSASEPVTSYETIKEKFLGTARGYDNPEEVEKGKCSNTDFWSQAQYPWGVLQNTLHLKSGETKTLVYVLGMERSEIKMQEVMRKFKDVGFAKQSLEEVKNYYDQFIKNSVNVQTPDKDNDRMINIWAKYQWRQFWKKSLNNGAYGLGLWSYGLEGETIGVTAEDFLLPFDMNLLKNCLTHFLETQVADTTQTDLFGPGEHTMLYTDLGIKGPPVSHKGIFEVPHHHSIYNLFCLYYYFLESGDTALLQTRLPYLEGNMGSVWDHIRTGLDLSVKGIDSRGFPRIPANVGDWMDEFTKISKDGNAESEMLAGEICYLLKGFSELAGITHHQGDSIRWMGYYTTMKNAVNRLAWDGNWYIRAFSDRGHPFIPVGGSADEEGKIYLNAQSWPVLSGIASREQATKSLNSVKKYLFSDYGPLVFSPAYSHYLDYIGTQSIYAPGFRNACIYLRPAGWAIAAACVNNQPDLANEMYNSASLESRERDMSRFHCEPYVYPENYDGPADSLLKGQGEFQWNLGEGTGWMWTAYVDYILGIRPAWSGLLIQPEIPAKWAEYRVKRPFRGDVYEIHVKNPAHVSFGVKQILVDGRKITGNIIAPFNDGKTHQVEVTMGR